MSLGEHLINPLPFTNASVISGPVPVRLNPSAARSVLLSASNSYEIQGYVSNATYAAGEGVTVFGDGAVVEAIAAASLGVNAEVGVASSNGAVGPISAASGVEKWRVGKSLEAAAAGEKFSLYVRPRAMKDNS